MGACLLGFFPLYALVQEDYLQWFNEDASCFLLTCGAIYCSYRAVKSYLDGAA
jgi:hypothetical protein